MLKSNGIYAVNHLSKHNSFYLCFNCFKAGTFIEEPFNGTAYQEALDWAEKSIEEIIVGCIRNKGAYTIVEEKSGTGASKWGLIKAYASGKNGWISLDYVKKV